MRYWNCFGSFESTIQRHIRIFYDDVTKNVKLTKFCKLHDTRVKFNDVRTWKRDDASVLKNRVSQFRYCQVIMSGFRRSRFFLEHRQQWSRALNHMQQPTGLPGLNRNSISKKYLTVSIVVWSISCCNWFKSRHFWVARSLWVDRSLWVGRSLWVDLLLHRSTIWIITIWIIVINSVLPVGYCTVARL